MQSAFTIRNRDSTPEPPSPNMAAASPAKRKFRKCTNCTSRMPSFSYENHTLCTRCRNQVCDMQLVCEECRDWPVTKCKVFVNYNNKLRTKREYKQRQARLAGAASDQSVYETDTDVPLDEPSVPVPNVHLDDLNLGQQQCLISEEVVVSAGPSTETATSDLLLLPPGSDLDKLAFTVLSRLSDLQSARGPQTPVQSQSMPSGLSQQAVILPNVCQPSVQSLSAGSTISQQGIILPNVCQSSVQAGSGISQPGVILPNVCQPVFTNNEVEGVTAPLHCLLTLPNQFSGSPRRPYLEGSSTKPLRALSPAMKGSRPCRKHSPPLVRRLLHFELAAFVRFNLFWTLPHRLPRNCGMLGYRLHGLGFRRLPSLGRPKWVLLVLKRPEGLLRRPKGLLIVQSRPQWVLVAQSSTLLSLVRLGDGLLTRLSVPRTTHLARGVILPPARGVGTLAICLTRTQRPRIASNGTTNRTKRIIFVLPHWTFC